MAKQYTEQRIDLVINRITQAKYDELKSTGRISDTELYDIIDHDDLFYYKTQVYNRVELDNKFNTVYLALASEVNALESELIDKIDKKDQDLDIRLSTMELSRIPEIYTEIIFIKSNISSNATNLENYKKTVASTYAKKSDLENTYLPITTHNSAVTNLEGLITTESNERKQAIQDLTYSMNDKDASLQAGIDAIQTNFPAINNRLQTAEGKLNILNGDANTEGSVQHTVTTAITNVIDGAPDAFNTLKEIADWISNEDSQTAADIIADINTVESDLNDYKTEVSEIYATKVELSEYSPVEANPELTGTEDVLESIQIDGTNYQVFPEGSIEFSEEVSEDERAMTLRSITVGSDIWNLGGISDGETTGGSDVVANPTLTGNEEILESLSVDGTSYSIGRDDFVLSTESKSGSYDLRNITVGGTSWNIVGSGSGGEITGDEVTLSTEAVTDGNPLKTIIAGNTKWSIPNIVFSETEPENPIKGMIWFFPAE